MIELFKKELKNLGYALQVSRFPLECTLPPRFVYVEPTNACVLNCRMCMRGKTKIRKLGFMDLCLYRKIIDDISPEVRSIALHKQGEPLLHPNLIDMINYAKNQGMKVGFNTNAVLLDEEKSKKLLETDLDWIYFSFDGPNKNIYEKLRKGADYERVKQNILRFIELRNKKGNMPIIHIYIIEMSDTENYLNKFVKYWKDKVDSVGINKLMNFFSLIDDEKLDWYNNIQKKDLPEDSYPICTFPWFTMAINWDGTAEYCLADFTGSNIVGNARKENVLQIWNNEKSKKVRKAVLQRDFRNLKCGQCSSLWTPKDQVPPSLKGYFFSKLLYLKGLFEKDEYNHRWQEQVWGNHFEWDPIKKKWRLKNLKSLIFE